MRHVRRSLAAAMAGIGTLLLLIAPSSALTSKSIRGSDAAIRLAHMTGSPGTGMMGQGWFQGPTQGYGGRMMGPGMMGPGMMGQGWNQEPAQGYGKSTMGSCALTPGCGNRIIPSRDLTTDDVRHYLQHQLEWQRNKRLKLGEVKEIDDDKIVADIATVDGSLVQRLEIDRHSGQVTQTE